MLKPSVGAQTLILLMLCGQAFTSAHAADHYLINGVSLNSASELRLNSYSPARKKQSDVKQIDAVASTPTERPTASYISEEIVVTVPRLGAKGQRIAPSLLAVFRSIDSIKVKQAEQRWLSLRAREVGTRVQLGYNPAHDTRVKSVEAYVTTLSLKERPSASLVRIKF